MDIRPIISTLMRHKIAASLIVLEIALSCAIVCNALFLIGGRLDRMNRTSGLDEDRLVRVSVNGIAENKDAHAITRGDIAALRAIPGVRAVTSTNQVTFGNSSWNSGVRLEREQTHENASVTTYMGGSDLVETLGVNLVAGRNFLPDEIIEWEALQEPGSEGNLPSVIVTRDVAEKLFPGQDPLGKPFYSWGDEPHRIIGVIDHLAKTNDRGPAAEYEYAVILPIETSYELGGNYLLRVDDPARRDEVLKAAMKVLETSGPTRIIDTEDSKTLEEMRRDFYRQDRAMAWMLVAVIVALLVVTALGIVGLASFWVQQRTKQIGIRRALGATRGQILRYFQTENFLLASIGIALGMLLAYGINQLLMGRYELPRLPLLYLPVGAVVLWLLGQVAVFWPARRAAAVPPALATRSV